MSVTLRPLARTDLRNITNYTRHRWDAAQAERYAASLSAAFDRLASSRQLGKKVEGSQFELLHYNHQSHVIIFEREDDGVAVVRVLHENMDIGSRLD